MKTITSFVLTGCLFIVTTAATPVTKQPGSKKNPSATSVKATMFQRFLVHRQHNDAALAWAMTSNEGVTGFIIERSYDGTYFDYLDATEVDNGAWNRYRDASVSPGYIYYRVIAVMDDGTTITSPIEMVRIVRHG